MAKEATLNKNVVEVLNSFPMCKARKRSPDRRNNAGEVDVTGCYRGRRIEFEGKIHDNQPTDLQLKRMLDWEEAGAATGTYWSITDMLNLMAHHFGIDDIITACYISKSTNREMKKWAEIRDCNQAK